MRERLLIAAITTVFLAVGGGVFIALAILGTYIGKWIGGGYEIAYFVVLGLLVIFFVAFMQAGDN